MVHSHLTAQQLVQTVIKGCLQIIGLWVGDQAGNLKHGTCDRAVPFILKSAPVKRLGGGRGAVWKPRELTKSALFFSSKFIVCFHKSIMASHWVRYYLRSFHKIRSKCQPPTPLQVLQRRTMFWRILSKIPGIF